MTLGAYTARWLATHTARLAPNARRAYASALQHHVLPALGTTPLAALTTRQVRDWLQGQMAAGRAVNSVKSAHGALSTVLMDAVLDGLCPINAAHGAGRRLYPARSRAVRVPQALTAAELVRLLVAARTGGSRWCGDAVTLFARTGLRLGELLALTGRTIEPQVPGLRIVSQYHGAGKFGPPKGGKPRLVEVSGATLALCQSRADPREPDRWLFPGPGRLPLHPSTVEWTLSRAVARAGLPRSVTVHSLRHTYASLLLAAGAPPPYVQQQLGHASYTITVDLYGSWLRPHRPDVLAVLEHLETARHGVVGISKKAAVLSMRRATR